MNLNPPNNFLFPLGSVANTQPMPRGDAPPITEKFSAEEFIKKYNGRGKDVVKFKKGSKRFCDFMDAYSSCPLSLEDEDEDDGIKRMLNAWRAFIQYEEMITDDFLFWMLYGELHQGSQFTALFHEQSKVMTSRYGRLKMNLPIRTRAGNYFANIWAEVAKVTQGKTWNSQIREILKWLSQQPDDHPIRVYRGFLCRKDLGERIRKSDDKGSADYWTQVEGAGTCYSLTPEIALEFANKHTDFNTLFMNCLNLLKCNPLPSGIVNPNTELKKWYGEMLSTDEGQNQVRGLASKLIGFDDPKMPINKVKVQDVIDRYINSSGNKAVDLLKEIFDEQKTMQVGDEDFDKLDKTYGDFGVRPMIGTYSMLPKDIISIHDRYNEAEIVAYPENVTLDRYDFITSGKIWMGLMGMYQRQKTMGG